MNMRRKDGHKRAETSDPETLSSKRSYCAFIKKVVREQRAFRRDLDIAVFGSIAMDEVVPVTSFALEETTHVESFCEYPGGSGATVAVGLSRLGVSVSFAGKVGCDLPGRMLVERILIEKVDLSQLVVSPKLATLRTVILVDKEGKKRIIVPTSNVALSLSSLSEIKWRLVNKASAVYIGEVFIEIAELISSYTKSRNKPVFYRLLTPFAKLGLEKVLPVVRNANVIYTNAQAWSNLQRSSPSLYDPSDLLGFGPDTIVITRSELGCTVYTVHKTIEIKAPDLKAIDSTGAGDAFAAAFTRRILDKKSVEEAAKYASIAAALSTTKRGAWASMPSHEDICRHGSAQG
jgi:ribokinase